MSIFRKVDVRVWSDEKFRQLSPLPPSGQSLWFFLLTGPFTGSIPGLFKAGPAAMAEELGWNADAFALAFADVIGLGMAEADTDARLIWLPNALKYNQPTSINVIKAWKHELEKLPECPLLYRALDAMEKEISTMGEGFIQAFSSVKPKPMARPKAKPMPKPLSSPIQEKEKEKEKKNEIHPRPAAATPIERDLLRDALAEAFRSRVPEYANPARENSNLLRLSSAIRRKAESAEIAPEVAALGCVETFWKLHTSGKQFYSDFTPSKMLAILESLWGTWKSEHDAFNVSWIDDIGQDRAPEPVGVSDDDF